MDLQAVISLARRRWWIVLLAMFVSMSIFFGVASARKPVYQATARLYLNVPGVVGIREQTDGVELSSRLLTSFAKVVNSDITTKRIAKAIDNKLTPEEIQKQIGAVPEAQTLIIGIFAQDDDPVFAARLANAAANSLATVVGDLGATATGGIKASVIDRAIVPDSRISPNPGRDSVVGLLLGLVIGTIVALALDALDRSIRTPDAAAEAFGAPYLSSVPSQRRLASKPLAALSPGSPAGEAYRVLRTAIRFRNSSKPTKVVLVTSAATGEGKSTVSANLAVAMSQDGARVILIDADLRRTRIARIFNLPDNKPGLSDVLLGDISLGEALQLHGRSLGILTIGTVGLNPSEALGSKAMVKLIEDAKAIADVVIVDAPPVLPVTDPAVLAALVDGTVLVSRWGRTSVHAAQAVRKTLENVGADVVGVVLNAEAGGRSSNYYRHYSDKPTRRWRRQERQLLPQSESRYGGDGSATTKATAGSTAE